MPRLSRFVVLIAAGLLAACAQAVPTPDPGLPTPFASETPAPTATLPTATPAQLGAEATPVAATPARVRIVHAAVDVPAINLYTGFQAAATNLGIGQVTEPISLDAGEHTVRVILSGGRESDPALLETALQLESGANVLLVLIKAGDNLELLIEPDAVAALNTGESAVTFINALSGSGAVTLQRDGGDISQAVEYGQQWINGLTQPGEASLGFSVLTVTHALNLEERQHYTVILTGTADNPRVVTFATTAPGRATVRTVNAATGINAIDIYLDDALLTPNVEYGRPTTRQMLTAGNYSVRVYAAGVDPQAVEPLVVESVAFGGQTDAALIIEGTAQNLIVLTHTEDLSATAPGQARIAFLNTLEHLPVVEMELGGGELPGMPGLNYGQNPPVTTLQAGIFNFYFTAVDATGVNNTVEVVENIQLDAGRSYLYLITGRLDNNPIILSEEVGIDDTLSSSSDVGDGEPARPTALRFINAVDGSGSIDFLVNDTPAALGVVYGQGSALLPQVYQSPTIQVRAGSDQITATLDTLLEAGGYTVIAYGTRQDTQLIILSDASLIFDGGSARIRLINLSRESGSLLGLGFGAAVVGDTSSTPEPVEVTAEATGELGSDGRRSIPAGVQRAVDNIDSMGISEPILMPTGLFDLYVIDSVAGLVTASVPAVTLGESEHYDIIAYADPDTGLVRAFALLYPPISN